MPHLRRTKVSACALAAATLLAACGGTSTKTPSTAETTSPSTQSTASTQTITKTVTANAPSGPALCRAATLTLTFLGQQGATGHGELGFALRNTSGTSCRTGGYPGVLFTAAGGGALPTIPTHTTHDLFGTAPVVPLVLAPGQSSSFRLGVTHGIASSAGCTTARGLQVIPPNDTSTVRVTIPDGAFQCRTVTVSPLRPGHSAYP
jgi:hypothetical protein